MVDDRAACGAGPAQPDRRRSRRQRRQDPAHATTWPRPAGCDIVAFPELSVTGYPPEDLVLKPGFVADTEAALGPDRRPHRAVHRGDRLRRRRLRPVQRRRRVRRRPGARHLPQASPAELRGVRRGPLLHAGQRDRPAGALRHRRRQGRHQHLRGHLEPRRAARRAGRRRGRARGQHQRVAVPPRQGRLPRAHARNPRPPTHTRRWSTSIRSAARTSSCSTAARSRSTPTATCSPAASSSSRTCSIVDVPIAAVYRQRLLDPRGRQSQVVAPDRAGVDRTGRAERAHRQPGRRADGLDRRAVPRARPRHARLLREERLHRRRDRTVRRHRLDARRGHRRRRARRRPRARRVDAVAVLVRPLQVRRREARRQPRPRLPDDLDRAGVHGVPGDARRELRRPPARPHPGEHPEPLPRSAADGAVERVRLDGAHHRQQERDGRRLLHDLRRLGRRATRSSRTC